MMTFHPSLATPTLYLLFLGGGGGKGSGNSSINHYITDYIIINIFVHVFALDGWSLPLGDVLVMSVCLETGG